jgi:YfiH family protein
MPPDAAPLGADWLRAPWHGDKLGALMTTRRGGYSAAPFASLNLGEHVGDDAQAVALNRAAFARVIGVTPVFLRQVHGTRVVRLRRADTLAGATPHEADACLSGEPGIACCVLVADCLPVLMAAPAGRGVAAAHAGWRGLAAGVVEAALDALCEAASCGPAEIAVWLGAAIGPQRFEVGADVLDAFGSAGEARFVRSAPVAGVPRWHADLAGLARDRLLARGVRDVSGGSWCTASDDSAFFSFRRDGVTGRMAAAVWIAA